MIQTLEDVLRACALQFRGDWDDKLPVMECAYNNSYQSSIGMSPYDALYGRQRRTPIYWDEVGEKRLEVSEDVEATMEMGKYSPRYIGPYEILERVGPVAYRLALPSELSQLHDVFHVSMLRKYISDPSHILKSQPIELKDDLNFVEQPVQILDWKIQVLRSREIPLVKILWKSHAVEEATLEPEEQM
ncbi:PREDICTED: uncharacterized protein LOC107881082 [Prunus mume]|uniref:Uncharacterized protein LOC107881082 n=1 Tax=Prunus mume TaxID=102107 RepID=A0ABM1LQF1_PRUMU|nr:PREDICTED: uncharacterized protein LOC107881082 [Prunus mume]